MRDRLHLVFVFSFYLLASCGPHRQIRRAAGENVLNDSALLTAHVGISIYEPGTGKYWYNYQGDKYFVPASNIKILTCYAAMKYLGDSLVGLRYGVPEEVNFRQNTIVIQPTGDPSFLHSDFRQQPVFEFLEKSILKEGKKPGVLFKLKENIERWGNGWSWNDYDQAYMAERNGFPVFGNVIRLNLNDSAERVWVDPIIQSNRRIGKLFKTQARYFDSLVNNSRPLPLSIEAARKGTFTISRDQDRNNFRVSNSGAPFVTDEIPFVTDGYQTALSFLSDTLKTTFAVVAQNGETNQYIWDSDYGDLSLRTINKWIPINSQPTDSLLKLMMHHSDNFFAEQSLLMVSNEKLGFMNDTRIIDTILKTDFKDLPQRPRWADGSGLSRYNLFTPQDMVTILDKMRAEFGMERIKEIFPTGNEGTLTNYYKNAQGYLFAKTGTLSGVVALSGYLYTKKNKLLIFSVLVNNHQVSATRVRRAVEKFIESVRDQY